MISVDNDIARPFEIPGPTPSEPAWNESFRRRRATPPGAEAMARPWRLGVLGIGIAIGIAVRLLTVNGLTDSAGNGAIFAAALTSLLAGLGVLAVSAERDRFGRWMILLSAMTGVSVGALQWISPDFPSGTLEWNDTTQFGLATLGVGNGTLFAGILTLALVRRWPTMTVVAVLAGAALTLAANTVLLYHDWPAVVALALAFLFVLLGWDRAPRHEPLYRAQEGSPRISRAALSLATVALSGAGIQLWVSRGQDIGRAGPAVGVSIVLLILAFLAMISVRREIQQRETTLSEWTAWMREFRTGDLRSEFESLGTTELGLPIGDLTAEPPRPLSFPDLRLDAPAQPVTVSPEPDLPAEPSMERLTERGVTPTAEPFDETRVDGEVAAVAPPMQPALFDDQPLAVSEVRWADSEPVERDLAAADQQLTVPQDHPALFAFESDAETENVDIQNAATSEGTRDEEPDPAPLPEASTASAFSALAGRRSEAPSAPATTEPIAAALAPTGAFSSWLGDQAPVKRGTPDQLAAWLTQSSASADRRLVVAIETMSLADFDMLPTRVSHAMNQALLDSLHQLAPAPAHAAVIDGPYLMVAWDHVGPNDISAINTTAMHLLSMAVETDEGTVALSGTLAVLRPGPNTTFDEVIDDAIVGLIHARTLEAAAKAL